MKILLLPMLALLISFAIGMFIAPLVIKFAAKLKCRQIILGYVTQHNQKVGTPTLGGIIFIIAAVITVILCRVQTNNMGFVAILIFLAYAAIGFLDDIIKIVYQRNLGLRAYQKIIAQILIAVIAAVYCYKNEIISTVITFPTLGTNLDLGIYYIPFATFCFLALSNAVNLTDGIDGLAGTSVTVYLGIFAVIIGGIIYSYIDNGNSLLAKEYTSLLITTTAVIGGVIAFLWHNNNKASIFMGDTGSLALGGLVAAVSLFSNNIMLAPLVGIVFVISCVSVIIQVIYFKLKKKRIFLMSPFHHHLELKGSNEAKIVGYYSIITFVCGIAALIII